MSLVLAPYKPDKTLVNDNEIFDVGETILMIQFGVLMIFKTVLSIYKYKKYYIALIKL